MTYWDMIAKIYEPILRRMGPYQEILVEQLRPHLNDYDCVLEIAAGDGQLATTLAEKVFYYHATDYAKGMIAEINRRTLPTNLKVSWADATDLPMADDTFDHVIAVNCLHIIPNVEKVITEMKRVLKNDGSLLIVNFLTGQAHLSPCKLKLFHLFGPTIYHCWTRETFETFLKNQGLVLETSRIIPGHFDMSFVQAYIQSFL